MRELKIDLNSVEVRVAAIKSNSKAISTSTSSLPEINKCSGIMISDYKDRIEKISKLLKNYKKLVEKDAEDILKCKDKLEEMDKSVNDRIFVFKTPF